MACINGVHGGNRRMKRHYLPLKIPQSQAPPKQSLEWVHGIFCQAPLKVAGKTRLYITFHKEGYFADRATVECGLKRVEMLFAPDECGAGNQYPHQIALAVGVGLVEQVFEMGAYGIA